MVTPAHIVPEWYFLPLYAVLRSVTNKLLGFFLIICFIICLFILPFVSRNSLIRSTIFRPLHAYIFWFLAVVCFMLGWIGSLPVMSPFFINRQIITFLYFFLILTAYPLANIFEKLMYDIYILKKNIKISDGFFFNRFFIKNCVKK